MSIPTRSTQPGDDLSTADAPAADEGGTAKPAEPAEPAEKAVRGRRALPRAVSWALTGLAAAFVVLALDVPNIEWGMTVKTFMRLPIEVIMAGGILIVMTGRARRWTATVLGLLLGLTTILKFLDIGFYYVMVRPWDPIFDWVLLSDGLNYVYGIYGKTAEIGAVVGAIALVVAVLVASILAVRRVSRDLITGHETGGTRFVALFAVAWVVCAMFGASIPGLPRATDITSAATYAATRGIPGALLDQRTFTKQLANDAFGNTPADQLLPKLKGKDVLFTFVESYGQTATQDPEITAILNAGTQQLESAGYSTRSAWMTSPITGGGSFLAHSTLYSGLWVNNSARYRNLIKSKRLTLTEAFHKANWRTVGEMPGLNGQWPEAKFFGYDKVYSANSNGFRGPRYNWASTPDQYILSNLQHSELAKPGHTPVMAQIETTSSHSPWTYVPTLVGWDQVGNGRATAGRPPRTGTHSDAWTRSNYRLTIQYALKTLISYVQTYGNQNLVLVFLGDHQPVPAVAGQHATRNVPITIVAKDKNVINQISSWNWTDGLKPGANAPTWRMDSFRDRFLTAFGSTPHPN